jgi:LacI family transcriptional regulator
MKATEVGGKRVTQDDVARRAGVTRSIVSYVLNDTGRSVAPETRARILRAIEELGYRPNKFAQGLMRGGSDSVAARQIGIVLNSADVFLRPYYAEILAGIHAAAHESGHHIRFIRFFNDLKNPILFNELIHRDEICGLILVSLDQSIATDEDRHVVQNIRERIPNIVCVEWQSAGLSSVTFDREEAARAATAHLLDKGYRDIVYVGESDNRIAGFRQAHRDRGLREAETALIVAANDMRSGFEAASGVFGGTRRPRAVFAGSDEVAIGILRYLNEAGIAVPDDVAIISIDNIEMAEFTNPPLTTINVQKAAMGRRAVDMIIRKSGGQDQDAVNVTLPTAMVLRESC